MIWFDYILVGLAIVALCITIRCLYIVWDIMKGGQYISKKQTRCEQSKNNSETKEPAS